MVKLNWGTLDAKVYEVGVDRGVIYPSGSPAKSWLGLSSVKEVPIDSTPIPYYVDGIKYLNRQTQGSFAITIDAYAYPSELEDYDVNLNFIPLASRAPFGFCYRTLIGGADDGIDHGYKLHLVYNLITTSSDAAWRTNDSSPDANLFSWYGTTTPMAISGGVSSAHLVIDSTKAHAWSMAELEDMLYGTSTTAPTLPTPDQVIEHFEEGSLVRVTDNGDGSFTVTGPDAWVHLTDDTSFEISWESAVYIDEVSYTISSL